MLPSSISPREDNTLGTCEARLKCLLLTYMEGLYGLEGGFISPCWLR